MSARFSGARPGRAGRLVAVPSRRVINAAEAAVVTGKSRRTIGRLLASGRIEGARRDDAGTWQIPIDALEAADLSAHGASDSPAVLRAQLVAWRRRAEAAEAAVEAREEEVDELRIALRRSTYTSADPLEAFWSEVPDEPRRRWRRRA